MPGSHASGAIVDAVADRVRREAPCSVKLAAAETGPVGDRAYNPRRDRA
jgi:hypothetical protein